MPKLPSAQLARVELTDDYADFWLVVRANPPMRLFEAMQSSKVGEVLEALAKVTTSSNVDHDSDDAPVDLTTTDGWRAMDRDFVEHVSEKIVEIWKLPLASRKTSSPVSQATASAPPTSTP